MARRVDRPDLDTVFRWIRDRSKNPYNPLGTQISLFTRSYGEYLAASDSRQVAKRTWVEDDREREQQAWNERQLRREIAAAYARARNTDARQREVLAIEGLALPVNLANIAH